MQVNIAKKAAGEKAAAYIQPGMTVGLGTGSTAYYTILRIGELVRGGMALQAVATSADSEQLAREQQIPLVPFAEVQGIDLDIDGADEADEQLRLIKGGGGALLREKIIAAAAGEMLVVIDESKLVKQLGRFPLPVEVIPFAWELTFKQLAAIGAAPVRREQEGQPFITDNGNYILDCHYRQIRDAAVVETQLNSIPGVVENGLFLHYAVKLIIGYADGTVKEIIRHGPARRSF
ncbi:ribose-5-phosphate isomerase RpiA [Chitinophaga nivalis]|uniref:Ribose-5-phosphate isomerase A n=1 Tax=Chitinophaga nivalis TaxID=2991709 RepID=A0ABT3INW6_9BACT|nr:ribose-5-phosphate isomerase RpiA [Chitinophaga nivalis]MCW3464649.1 ribose-5-phosphate isomerase RpiA [Chitinophaga nivalis]MCW3485660.1 ribose-5-phosphate isomerase RpiA [Chitinophaga nivalis]